MQVKKEMKTKHKFYLHTYQVYHSSDQIVNTQSRAKKLKAISLHPLLTHTLTYPNNTNRIKTQATETRIEVSTKTNTVLSTRSIKLFKIKRKHHTHSIFATSVA